MASLKWGRGGPDVPFILSRLLAYPVSLAQGQIVQKFAFAHTLQAVKGLHGIVVNVQPPLLRGLKICMPS